MTVQYSEKATGFEDWGAEYAKWNLGYAITGFHKMRSDEPVPAVRGFVRSPFNPLIYHSVKQAYKSACMTDELPAERKGILLGSMFVDAITQEEIWRDLIHGRKVSPIMFPQSVPSSIIGYLAKELEIHGPMSCMGASRNGLQLLIRQAMDWMEDDEADAVIVCCCDIPSIRADLWTKAYLGEERSFGGGVISFVIEPIHNVAGRNPSAVIPLSALIELHQASSSERFHGMAFGLDDE